MGFHWYEYVFELFKVTLKMVTEPLKEGTREIFSFVPNGVNFFSKTAENSVF